MKSRSILVLIVACLSCRSGNGASEKQDGVAASNSASASPSPSGAPVGGSEAAGPGPQKVTLYQLARTAHAVGSWCLRGRLEREVRVENHPEYTWVGFLVGQVTDLCGSTTQPPRQVVISGAVESDVVSPYCTQAKDCRLAVGSEVLLFAPSGDFPQTGESVFGNWEGIPVFPASTGWILDSADGKRVSLETPSPHGDMLMERANVSFEFLARTVSQLAISTPDDVQGRCAQLRCPSTENCLWGEGCGTMEVLGDPDPCLYCDDEPGSAGQSGGDAGRP